MKISVLVVLAMAAVMTATAAFAANSTHDLVVISVTQTIGVASQGKSEISGGVELAYGNMFGLSLYSGGEKVAGRGTQFGGDARIYPTNFLRALFGVNDLPVFADLGMSTYGELGMYHVANSGPSFDGFAVDPAAGQLVPTHVNGGGDYNRIAGGGGLSFTVPVPKNIGMINGIKVDLGFHTHRGIVAGLGLNW